MNALEVNGLSKSFVDFQLEDISFSLPSGFIMGYVGQNGAGKTTTLNLITHLIKADAGEVRINGITYEDDPILYKDSIGFIGDETYFPLEFNVLEIKGIFKDFYRSFREDEFMKLIKKWKLPEKKMIKDFSRGMKVRLMFASVLARDTRLLILDEATNGLDPVIKDEIMSLIQDYIADGQRSVIFSTHILSDLEQIADYLFFINDGKKILCGEKDDILENYVLVKGGPDDLDQSSEKKLIGLKKTSVGFEGILESDMTVYLNKKCLIEKPTIDQIVVHFIRSMEA